MHGAGPDADPVEHVGHKVAGVLPRHKHQHQVPGRGEPFSKKLELNTKLVESRVVENRVQLFI